MVGVSGNFHDHLRSPMSQPTEQEPLTRFTELMNELLPVSRRSFLSIHSLFILFLSEVRGFWGSRTPH
jgi:hypothetical protein